jgi:hypothetical protein
LSQNHPQSRDAMQEKGQALTGLSRKRILV